MHFYDYKTVFQVSKQASTAYGVCEVWKQELSTLIAIISLSASSWFSANYTISLVVFGKFQEEAIASCCLLLATPMFILLNISPYDHYIQ